LYLAKVMAIPDFFQEFLHFLFKKIQIFQNFSMRSYGELLLTYLTGATTSLQSGPVVEDPSIALYLELGRPIRGP
jgi:hypothetical protein